MDPDAELRQCTEHPDPHPNAADVLSTFESALFSAVLSLPMPLCTSQEPEQRHK